MGRFRRFWLAAGAGAVFGSLFAAGTLWAFPTLALHLDDLTPFAWWVGSTFQIALLILIGGGTLAALPRRVRGGAAAGLAGMITGAAILLLAFPPALRWTYDWPGARRLGFLDFMWDLERDWHSERLSYLDYKDGVLSASTTHRSKWQWDRKDGRLLDRHGSVPFDWSSIPSRVKIGEIPMDRIRDGVPVRVFLEGGPVARTYDQVPARIAVDRIGRRGLDKDTITRFWRMEDTKLLLTVRSPSTASVSRDGKLAFVSMSFRARPIPGLRVIRRSTPPVLGEPGTLYDLENDRVLWDRWYDSLGGASFSPGNTYLLSGRGRKLLETATGRVLGEIGGQAKGWAGEDEYLVMKAGDCIDVHRLPGLEKTGTICGYPEDGWEISKDAGEVAIPVRNQIHVMTFPELRPVRRLFIVTSDWLLDRAALFGLVTGVLCGIFAARRPREQVPRSGDPSRERTGRWGKFALFAYLLALPVAAFAPFSPVDLPDVEAAISLIVVTLAVFVLSWNSFRIPALRFLACGAVTLATVAVLMAVFHSAREPLGTTMPSGSNILLDERWAYDSDSGIVFEIESRKPLGRLSPRVPYLRRMRREGDTLRARYGQAELEWDVESWSLKGARVLPMGQYVIGGMRTDYGVGRDGNVVPLLTLPELLEDPSVWNHAGGPEGTRVFTMGSHDDVRLYSTRLGTRSYLEIPLHAAMGALMLAGLFGVVISAAGRRRPKTSSPDPAGGAPLR